MPRASTCSPWIFSHPLEALAKDRFQCADERIAFGITAHRDTQAVVDAWFFEVAHQDTGGFQFIVERFGRGIGMAHENKVTAGWEHFETQLLEFCAQTLAAGDHLLAALLEVIFIRD